MVTKQFFLSAAEVVDAFRIFPRFFLALLGVLVWHTINWFMGLDNPNSQQASLVVTVTGIIPVAFNFYLNSSRKWEKKDGSNS